VSARRGAARATEGEAEVDTRTGIDTSGVKTTGKANRPRGGNEDDRALVRRAQDGDRAAFRQLVERNQAKLYQVAITVLRDHEEAMDVVQEALIKLHKNLLAFKGDALFSTWAHRVTYNVAVDALRRVNRHEKTDVEETTLTDEGTQYEPWTTGESDPVKHALRGDLWEQIQRAIDQLNPTQRAVFVLREVHGLGYDDIAATLQIPKGTVMSRLFNARNRMQALMAGYLGENIPTAARSGGGLGDE